MAGSDSSEQPSIWHPVHGDQGRRDGVAPSKPVMPSTGSVPVVPQPVEEEDAEVIAPVPSPPHEEIMPRSRGALWSADPAPAEDADDVPTGQSPPSQSSADAFRDLGDAAVRNASFAASGAPTPLGGVPQVPSQKSAPSAPATPRTAWFAGDPRTDAPDGAAAWSAGTRDDDPVPPTLPPEDIPELADDEPAYTPLFGVPTVHPEQDDAPAAADDEGDTPPPAAPAPHTERARPPWWMSVPTLTIVGLLVMGGLGYGAWELFAPEQQRVELTPEVLVAGPAGAAVEPVAIEDPSAFQAALPPIVGAYAMTGFEQVPASEAGLTETAAEVDLLTYSDGATELEMRAIQHYDVETATAQFEALAEGGTDREPVEAGGEQVGERATVASDGGETIVWRNGSAVFELTGPADAAEPFYALFPL